MRCEEVSPVLVIKDVCSNQVNVESLASALDEKWKLGKRSLHFNHDVRPRVDEHKVKKVKRAFFDKLLGVQRKVEFEETQGIPRVPSRTSIITDSTQSAEVSPVVEGQALEQQRFDQNMKRVGSLSEMLNTKRAEMTRQKLLDTEQDLMGGEDAFAVAKQEILSQGASTSLAQGPEEHRGVYGKSAFLNQ